MTSSINYCSALQSLPSGSEVTVHTKDKSYYNTIFKRYYPRTNTALIVIDPFYSLGGYPVLIPCHEIVSIDLPNSIQGVSDEDE
ncbi:hypothetical protein CHH83_08920 [Bacillus sp. 7586-K]|uniref:Uncharacterized protein n=1 Tax=Metabacillus niabensis TaxID=324854 RepID=A0ABT9YVY3_9BACI|nr:hypothetical protein [Metabacillus niabensis]MDQ0223894.1 hypothetical protein [Metabacillus niabensis]PAD69258.1 hypothetical protein CHH83_08920 [Bacillus sp. 7586-K]